MAGQGKYTVYAPPASDKNTLLNKLFKGNSRITSPLVDLVGKEVEARQQVVARGKQFLTPAHQQGDPGYLPNGVNLDFSGDPNGISAPDTTEDKDVVWEKAGDPANSFTPDLRSPGPGQTDASSADNLQSDPELSVADVKGPSYVVGAPKTGTRSPAKTGPAVHQATTLGSASTLGDSGANNAGA